MSADLCLYQQSTSWNSNLFRLLKELCSPWLPGPMSAMQQFVYLCTVLLTVTVQDGPGHFIIKQREINQNFLNIYAE